MTSKEFFLQVKKAETELKMLQARLRHYEDLGLSSTSNISASGGHQKGNSRVEQAAIGIVDATKDLNDKIRHYSAIITRAEHVIGQIQQEKYRQILSYRYLSGWSFRSISDELKYSDPRSIYRAHGWALAEAQKILNREDNKHGT